MRSCLYVTALIAAGAASQPAAADNICETESDNCIAIGHLNFTLGVGYGSRSNPIVSAQDIPLILVPQFSYYGKRFFVENLDAGFTLHENASNAFNVVASPGYDRVFFYRNDLQNFFIGGGGLTGPSTAGPASTPPPATTPPPGTTPAPASPGTQITQATDADLILARKRHTTYLVGPEWNFNYGGVVGQLDALYEVTGHHNGTEFRAAVAVPLIRTAGTLTASAGATWKSSELVTYYYGEPGIYDAGSAFSPFAKLSYTLTLNEHWNINALAHVEKLGDSIADSPIVLEQYVTTVYAGVAYSF